MWGDQTPRATSDATQEVIDRLVTTGFDARTWYPTEATPEDDRTPVLAVLDIGNADDSYTTAAHLVQVTAWEVSRADSIDLRAESRAVLVMHPGSDSVSWVRPVSLLTAIQDDVTGLWMAPFTVRIQLRALAV